MGRSNGYQAQGLGKYASLSPQLGVTQSMALDPMRQLERCHLILEPQPLSGFENMRRDASLLSSAATSQWPEQAGILRFYAWKEPTLSIGYFQKLEAIVATPRWQSLPVVRRLSGGGAILHDCEWTYSLTVPHWPQLVERPHELYARIHQPIVDVLNSIGIPAQFRGVTNHLPLEPDLCFLRSDENDLVIRHQKILGSAQRRRKGSLLQHGSLILSSSPVTPEIHGISDICGTAINESLRLELATKIASNISQQVHIHNDWPAELSSLLNEAETSA